MQEDKGLDDVIAKFRAQRELQKAAAANAASLKVQAEVNAMNANTNKTLADTDHKKTLSEEAKARLESKARIAEANVNRINADAELLKAKSANLEEKTRNESDQLKIDLAKADAAKIAMEVKREEVSVREQTQFASNMEKLRETIEGPIDHLLTSISTSTNFDARKKPLTTLIATAGIGLNSLATQDRTPPIYGMLAKLAGFMATTVSFYGGKGIESIFRRISNPGVSKEALKLVETDAILKEVATTNRALAIEMAQLKIARFKQATTERFEKEKNQFTIKENNKTSQSSTKTETITKENLVQPKEDNTKLYSKLDDIILLVKNISNQYDSETDNERYVAEIKWRAEVLDKLGEFKSNQPTDKKSGFGLLEFGALAGIGAYVGSIISSITKFISPLLLLSRALLPMAIPLTLAATALMTMDWTKDIVDPIQTIIKTFKDGKALEGITRLMLMPPELVLKFANRVVASISGLLGFEKTEKELNAYVDKINIFDSIISFKNKILNYFEGTLQGFNDTFDSVGLNIKDKLQSILKVSILAFQDFDLSSSIKEFFNALSDKIESLKFWKKDKEYKTDLFKNNQSEIIKKEVSQVNFSKLSTNNITENSIEKIENRIEKRQSNSITNLNKNFTDLQRKKEEKDSSNLQQLIEKTTSIVAPISNTQINNNSSSTSIASRPYPRIYESTADRSGFNNRSGDFSGFLMG
jgi:hypothetical protein